ncbi:hypothetical protein CcrC1_gp209 [Caulobacter phage C1]|nr:hypothetical protein CcrC1_gp209 [Caulobacter phage C1]UTU08438.1 hypothetical protein CcrC2_gp210 [Caulobacter phage C2]UTU08955.1 hypothetical protein CcrJ4_gp204 [Caulobacter phage J4]UTU09513.1 hypothetical protein CcrBL47_gp227 [Caulobacter phage BL47]UTU10071.1 hypothetical protein CcrRB23_gp209 [Caulobacter phage RB23]WGN97106.1 hypothetical protein [Bertelyvirus sp.]
MPTPKKHLILYAGHDRGSLKARVVGTFMRSGQTFNVIHPGYDAQGRRRSTWTQVCVDDVPVWEWKLTAPISTVLENFDRLMSKSIGKDKKLLKAAIRATQNNRRDRFKDGVSGVEPAPSLTLDGRTPSPTYVA